MKTALTIRATALDRSCSKSARHAGLASACLAFTLLELLTVIAIIGIIAAIALPNLKGFAPNTMSAASRQLLNDVARARQFAISQRTTVYMVFVPPSFWTDPNYGVNWTAQDYQAATNLFGKQLVGYNFIALRTLGDQPGQGTPRYLSSWRTMPEGSFIATSKFGSPLQTQPSFIFDNSSTERFDIYSFRMTNNFPFPLETTAPTPAGKYTSLYYVGFNHQGQLVDARNQVTGANELIPLALGSVGYAKPPVLAPPSVRESPTGNSSNSFNIVSVDWLTGRARLLRQEIR